MNNFSSDDLKVLSDILYETKTRLSLEKNQYQSSLVLVLFNFVDRLWRLKKAQEIKKK